MQVQVEPVGRWFEAYFKRRNRSTSASFQELEEEEESEEESEDEEFQLEEYPMLRTLDPKDWKVSDETRKLFYAPKTSFFFHFRAECDAGDAQQTSVCSCQPEFWISSGFMMSYTMLIAVDSSFSFSPKSSSCCLVSQL